MARVLVVDDDEQICTLVSRLLENDGHTPDVANTGVEALAKLADDSFDLMLLDLVMPDKGGIETIMEIRRTAPGLPIVVMSGKVTFGEASVTRLIEQYGALATLPKPFSSDELRKAVMTALSR
ncbi:MAG: response regulator [Spirochaetota bacterium]